MTVELIPIPVTETIRARHSARTFEPRPISPADRDRLFGYLGKVSNPFGARIDIRLLERATSERGEKLGTYGVIKGAVSYLAVTLNPQFLGMLAAGYQFESLLLCATHMGLGSVMLALTFDREGFAKAVGLGRDELLPVVSPVGYVAQRRSTKEKMMRASLHASRRKPWADLFFGDEPTAPLTQDAAGAYAEALEMARLAPSGGNAQPWRVLKCGNAFHFFEEHKDGLSAGEEAIKELDLGIAVAHFHQTALSQGLQGSFERIEDAAGGVPANWHYHISWVAE